MNKSQALIALSAILVALSTPANAQSYEKMLAQLTERFSKVDSNGDGKLTQKEAKDGGMKRVARYFSRLDEDGDGFVTFDQLKARLDARNK